MPGIEIMDWERARAEAAPIRFAVFVEEQKVPVAMELDELDAVCLHAIARIEGRAVGTGRLLPAGPDGVSHIGRMAVAKPSRSLGVGAAILQALMQAARERGDRQVVLSAQIHASGFYARQGYVAEGDEYLDAGIRHRSMRAIL